MNSKDEELQMRYMRMFVGLMAVLVISVVAACAETVEEWGVVGQNPVCDTIENVVAISELPPELKPEAIRVLKATTIPRDVALSDIAASSAPEPDKAKAKAVVEGICFKFYAVEYFRNSRAVHPDIMKRFEARVDKSLYRVEPLKKGDTFKRMTFGKDGKVRISKGRVIFTEKKQSPDGPCPVHVYQVKVGNVTGEFNLCADCDNFGHGWERGEIVSERGKPAPARIVAQPGASAVCPDGIALNVHVWDIAAMPEERRQRAIALFSSAAEKNSSDVKSYQGDSFSRIMGEELLSDADKREKSAAREGKKIQTRAAVNADVKVELLDPSSLRASEDLGTVRVEHGIARILLTEARREKVIRTTFPKEFRSPAHNGVARQIYFFPYEWDRKGSDGKQAGKWCRMHEHAAVELAK